MDENIRNDAEPNCPLCAMWSAWKKSEVAQHVRGLRRESLLLARSLLNVCIRQTESQERPPEPEDFQAR